MRLTLDRNLSALVQRMPRASIYGVMELLLMSAVAVQGARFAYALVTPTSPVGEWRARLPVPMDERAQSALFAAYDPFYPQQAVASTATITVTSLPLELFGVRTNAATGGGSAILAGSDGVQKSIGTGEEIQPGVRLVGVFFDHVEIDNAGKRESLYLDQGDAPAGAAAAAPATDSPAAAQPAAAPPAPISPASIRAGIAFAPRSIDGRVSGISVSAQGDGSAFAAVGFRPGDVIRSVNGRTIASAADVAALNGQLQPGARLSLEVERGAGTAQIAVIIPNGQP